VTAYKVNAAMKIEFKMTDLVYWETFLFDLVKSPYTCKNNLKYLFVFHKNFSVF